MKATANGYARIRGLTAMANAISREFKTTCKPVYIRRWLLGRDTPPGAPPFPAPEPNAHRAHEWPDSDSGIEWYRLYKEKPRLEAAKMAGLPVQFDLAIEEERNRKEEIEHERWERETQRQRDDKNYILRAESLNLIYTLARIVNGRIDSLERFMPKAVLDCAGLAGIPADQREALPEQLRAVQAKLNRQLKSEIQAALDELSHDRPA